MITAIPMIGKMKWLRFRKTGNALSRMCPTRIVAQGMSTPKKIRSIQIPRMMRKVLTLFPHNPISK
jgi:hypothetical protein